MHPLDDLHLLFGWVLLDDRAYELLEQQYRSDLDRLAMVTRPPVTLLATGERGARPAWCGRGNRTSPFCHRATSCHCWLVPVPTGHWMTRAPSAADPLATSAHQPLRTLTSR